MLSARYRSRAPDRTFPASAGTDSVGTLEAITYLELYQDFHGLALDPMSFKVNMIFPRSGICFYQRTKSNSNIDALTTWFYHSKKYDHLSKRR